MKKSFFILLILTCSLFAEIDERKSDIYFANSIKTDQDDSIANIKLISKNLKTEQYNSNQELMDKELFSFPLSKWECIYKSRG